MNNIRRAAIHKPQSRYADVWQST